MRIEWTIGVEVELLAPRGSSRKALADHLAASAGGRTRTFFHPQQELSLVPNVPVFENLTLGFEALDARGELIARCVDDLTLQDDLDPHCAPVPGWFRVVGDDMRLLGLVKRHGRADASPMDAVAPVAELFGTTPERFPDGIIRVTDELRAPIAIASPLPGERERPCEIVTPPLARDHATRLERLLEPARAMGFTLAKESATHIHFDATRLRSPRVFANLVRLFDAWGPTLKRVVGTNPACRRLGGWPDALLALVNDHDFVSMSWEEAREPLQALELTKYCDFNVKNVVHEIPGKPTFEVRVLPGLTDAEPILACAALFESVLRLAVDSDPIAPSSPLLKPVSALHPLPLDPHAREWWSRHLAS